jgi:hypothetical protein
MWEIFRMEGFSAKFEILNNWSHGTGFKIFSVFLNAKILYISIINLEGYRFSFLAEMWQLYKNI